MFFFSFLIRLWHIEGGWDTGGEVEIERFNGGEHLWKGISLQKRGGDEMRRSWNWISQGSQPKR